MSFAKKPSVASKVYTPDYQELTSEQKTFISSFITLPAIVIEKLNEFRIYKKHSIIFTVRYSLEKTMGGKTWNQNFIVCEWWMRNDKGQPSNEVSSWCKEIPHESLEEFNRVFNYDLEIKEIPTPEESLEEINKQIKELTERAERLKRPRADDALAKEDLQENGEKKMKI